MWVQKDTLRTKQEKKQIPGPLPEGAVMPTA